MPKLLTTKLIAGRHAARMVSTLDTTYPGRDISFIKHDVEARKVIHQFFIDVVRADRAEQRRFRRQQDALAAQAKEVADRWTKR